MSTLEAIHDFLAQKRIAVAGVSSTKPDAPNLIYRKLRDSGYQVYAINPKVQTVEGDPCYPDLKSLPEKVDAVVIGTRPEVTEQIVRECAELGISRVWMHYAMSFLGGSYSEAAVNYCHEHNISVIPGGCPMMFVEPVDFGHKCLRWFSRRTGTLPK